MVQVTSHPQAARSGQSRPFPIRVELVRQLRRRRTLVAYLLVVALPIIVVAAVKFGPSSSDAGAGRGRFGGGSADLVGLATQGAANFTVTMLLFASGFLLTVIVALFCGDTVASEASWSTLRYLLAAPVPRRRLLTVKLVVALLLTAGSLVILVLISLLLGTVFFGSGPLSGPTGGAYSAADSFGRVALMCGYVFVSLLFPAGIAFLMTVLTDVPLGAVGAAVVITIVSGILDAITALGSLRDWLPTHYSNAWVGALAPTIDVSGMARGFAYATITFAVLIAVAYWRFDRKDIVS